MKLLKYENMKLKQQFIFNLPATKEICGKICPGCYALKAQVRFPKTVIPYRERMLEESMKSTFMLNIIKELLQTKKEARTVRIHESGEFYSQEYINKWHFIASSLPDFTFYAFTKRINDFDFSSIKSLSNVIIIDSQKFGPLNYGNKEELLKLSSDAKICPSVGCGTTCRYCMTKEAQEKGVLFEKH